MGTDDDDGDDHRCVNLLYLWIYISKSGSQSVSQSGLSPSNQEEGGGRDGLG